MPDTAALAATVAAGFARMALKAGACRAL